MLDAISGGAECGKAARRLPCQKSSRLFSSFIRGRTFQCLIINQLIT